MARGLDDTKYYTMECSQLYVATDHKSLVSVLGDQSLADVELRRGRYGGSLQSFKCQGSFNWLLMHYPDEKELSLTKY